jgi:hypothetical protein
MTKLRCTMILASLFATLLACGSDAGPQRTEGTQQSVEQREERVYVGRYLEDLRAYFQDRSINDRFLDYLLRRSGRTVDGIYMVATQPPQRIRVHASFLDGNGRLFFIMTLDPEDTPQDFATVRAFLDSPTPVHSPPTATDPTGGDPASSGEPADPGLTDDAGGDAADDAGP